MSPESRTFKEVEAEAEEDTVEEVLRSHKLVAVVTTEEDQTKQKTKITMIWFKERMENNSCTLNVTNANLSGILLRNAQKVATQERALHRSGIFLCKVVTTRKFQGHGSFLIPHQG